MEDNQKVWKYQNTNEFRVEVQEIFEELSNHLIPTKKYPAEVTEIQYEGELIDK